jgi:hypothetical protein
MSRQLPPYADITLWKEGPHGEVCASAARRPSHNTYSACYTAQEALNTGLVLAHCCTPQKEVFLVHNTLQQRACRAFSGLDIQIHTAQLGAAIGCLELRLNLATSSWRLPKTKTTNVRHTVTQTEAVQQALTSEYNQRCCEHHISTTMLALLCCSSSAPNSQPYNAAIAGNNQPCNQQAQECQVRPRQVLPLGGRH